MSEYKLKKGFAFPLGHVFYSEDGKAFTVVGFLGAGGQGEAYRVRGADGEYAVKYYHRRFAQMPMAEKFRQNIARNVKNGIPKLSSGDAAAQFIWPLKMIRPEQGSFGYLMKLFPEGYESLGSVFLQSRWDPDLGRRVPLQWKSWFTCITAALNIVRAFEILHASGLSYQDLNEGGFSVDMDTGNILICDCDNVAPDKTNLGIRGWVTYMAPEVACGQTLPNHHTDEYSLAILLFRLFFHGHPMEGTESRQLHNSEQLSREEADRRIYGREPHYCLASDGNRNPPDPVFNRDVCRLCMNFPMVLMNAFEQVFTEGVRDPSRRLTATEWRKILMEVRDSLVLVNEREQFYFVRGMKPLPPECRSLVYADGRRVLCMPGKILYRCHMDPYGTDFRTPVIKIIPTQKSGVIGLYNGSGSPIRFSSGGGEGYCPDQQRIPLLIGMTLELGNARVRVE